MTKSLNEPLNTISQIIFLGKILEQLYLVLQQIEINPTPTTIKVAEELLVAARLIQERISEMSF